MSKRAEKAELAAWRDVMSEALAEMDAYDMGGWSDVAPRVAALREAQRGIEYALRKIDMREKTASTDLDRAKAAVMLIAAACVNAEKLKQLGYRGSDADVERFEAALAMMKEVVAEERAARGPVRLAP